MWRVEAVGADAGSRGVIEAPEQHGAKLRWFCAPRALRAGVVAVLAHVFEVSLAVAMGGTVM